MIYAYQDGQTLIIAAADDMIEFEDFMKALSDVDPADIGASRMAQADFMTMMTDKRLEGIKRPPMIINFTDEVSLTAFVGQHVVSLVKLYPLQSRSQEMVADFKALAEDKDSRTIGEIYGMVEEEEEGEEDEDGKKMKKAQSKGHLSGDSFGPSKKKKPKTGEPDSKVGITDVHVHRNADGSVTIDSVLAVKGLHDTEEGEGTYAERTQSEVTQGTKTYAEAIAAQKQREADEAAKAAIFASAAAAKEEQDDEDPAIEPNSIIAIYHKVEVTGAKLADVRAILSVIEFDIEKAIRKQNNAAGCWLAFIRQLQAEEVESALKATGLNVEVYGVNDMGERLAPKGVTVVDELAAGELHPRPWNFRAAELKKMSEDELKANRKTLSGKEFLMVGRYRGADRGTILHIVPRVHFKAKGRLWDKPLDIDSILPQDFEELEPGVYRSMSRDWNQISFDMASRGFSESIALQLSLNNLTQ